MKREFFQKTTHLTSSARPSVIASKKIIKGVLILAGVLSVGTSGYMFIEDWDFLSSLYMTVITITTVGFGEIGKLSALGRIFTIFIIFFGVGIIAYIFGLIAQGMVDFQVRTLIGRRKLGFQLRSVKNHFIVCGFGRLGKTICRELKANHIHMVVIDSRPEMLQTLEEEDIPYIIGDATREDILLAAAIERAKGLVSVVASDADNVFIAMSARGLNPKLFILSRAEAEHTEQKLLRAGANRVVLPYNIGAQKMAHIIIKPIVSDFLELTVHNKRIGLEMGEVLVDPKSRLNGTTLLDSNIRKELDLIIVAIHKKDGEMKFNPSSMTRIEAEDTLIVLGKSEDIAKLAKIVAPEKQGFWS